MALVQEILSDSEQLFDKRASFMSYLQELAEQFYPERADFTTQRYLGDEFMTNLTTSYPVIACRELGNTLSSMLRPKSVEWFRMGVDRPERLDQAGKQWLEWATGTQRRAMYERAAMFARATKEGDRDYAAFGQCVISVELNPAGNGFLYRCWHVRDVAWRENVVGQIDVIHRRWKPCARDLAALFPGKLHQSVERAAKDEPYKEIQCLHVILPSSSPLVSRKFRQPFVSLHIDRDNAHVMQEVGVWVRGYVIPRWQTVSGSQYAHSPAAVAALPDARLIQAVTLTLLEAGEMAAGPPMLAVQEAIRGDVDLRSRGITWVDAEYDERLGEVLRPVTQNTGGLPFGLEVHDRAREMIAEAFYLNKLALPPATGREMTAYEVSQRVQEFIRTTLPLFEPIEEDYNGALCEETFNLGLRAGLFGPIEQTLPPSLSGLEIQWQFQSPLSEAADRKKGAQYMETANLLAVASQVDPSAAMMVDAKVALRDALEGIGTPAKWLIGEEQVAAAEEAARQAQAVAATVQGVGDVAGVAEQAGNALQSLQAAGLAA